MKQITNWNDSRKRRLKQQMILLFFLFLMGRSMPAWGQYNYEIDMNWWKADVENSQAYKEGAIVLSTGKGSDQAIVIKKNKVFRIYGSNALSDNSFYYRIKVESDATICLDNASIIHSSKVPIWIANGANVKLYIMNNSILKAKGGTDSGIEVEANSSLTIEQRSGFSGTLEIYGESNSVAIGHPTLAHGNITINSGNLKVKGENPYPAIGGNNQGNITINGGNIKIGADSHGIGKSNSTVAINGGTISSDAISSFSGIEGSNLTIGGSANINLPSHTLTSPSLTINNGTIKAQNITGTNTTIVAGTITCENISPITTIIRGGTINAGVIDGSDVTIEGGEVTSTSGISPTTTKITGGNVKASGTYALYTNLSLSGGTVQATGTTYGLNGKLTITNGELHLKGGTADVSSSSFTMKGGDVSLDGTVKSLGSGNYFFEDGTLVTTQKFDTRTSCDGFDVTGGSVIVNTPSKNIGVYRVKVRGYDLTDNQKYSCTVNGKTFTTRLIDGYFHFWVPALTSSITVNGKTIPIDQITTENDPTWYLDNTDSKKVNKAPLAAKEFNGSTLINRYFDFKSAFAGVTTDNTLATYYSHPSFFNESVVSNRSITLDLNGCTLSGIYELSVTAGTLKLKDTSTNPRGQVVNTIAVSGSGALRLEGTPLPALNSVSMDNLSVWWGQIIGNPEVAVQNVKQGGGRTLTLNQHYFIDPDKSMYCWLDNTKNSLSFENTASPTKYYYTSDPDPSQKHGQLLTLNTYKASINNGITTIGYKSLSEAFDAAASGQTIKLEVDGESHGGTLTAKASVTFDGNGKTMTTTASGLTLDATSYPIKLFNVQCASSKLIIKGKVFMDDSSRPSINTGVAQNTGGTPVYYCTTTNPSGTITKITYNGTETSNYYQDRTTLHLWFPNGNNAAVRIETSIGAVYTYTGNVTTTHYQALPFYATEFDISKDNIDLTTSLSGNQSVAYNGATCLSPVGMHIIIGGTTTSGNNITLRGSGIGNVTLKNLSIKGGSNPPLSVTDGTTLNLTVTNSNALVSGSSDAIKVVTGCRLDMMGAGVLTVSATNASYQDINNAGSLNLSGSFTLNAANSRFKPTAEITENPVIQLGGVKHYLAKLSKLNVGTITDLKYTSDNTAVQLYAEKTSEYYFWVPASSKSRIMDFIGTLPAARTLYTLPAASFTAHGQAIGYERVVASITSSGSAKIFYSSLAEAFAAATNGQTVTLENSYTLPANSTSTLSKLAVGQIVTLDLGNHTLTASNKSVISSGNGILTLTAGIGSLTGAHSIAGCLYSELASSQLGTLQMEGPAGYRTVYRTLATNLPTGIGSRLTYQMAGEPREYKAILKSGNIQACLWLPVGQQNVTLTTTLSGNNEIFATMSLTVNANHDNSATIIPLLDIGNGNITVTASSSNLTVKYGQGSGNGYSVTLTGNSLTNRLLLQGSATPENGKDYNLTVAASSGMAYLRFDRICIQLKSNKPALIVNGAADIELVGDNLLKGGVDDKTNGVSAAVNINNVALTLRNDISGMGRLYANGAMIGDYSRAAILVEGGGKLTITGLTLIARRGKETLTDAIEGGTHVIEAGNVDALYKNTRPTNKGGKLIYKVAVTTGLNPGQVYKCSYKGCSPENFLTQTDASGKVYCWLPEQLLSADNTEVTLIHPDSYAKTVINVVQVETNDNNVAPIVISMTKIGGASASYGNLKDAFDAMTSGTSNLTTKYSLNLLTHIQNLRTAQIVPEYTEATLDLNSFEISAQNGSGVSFDASANGAYLKITGKGNIKNTVQIAGDVFIAGVVPLTDAVIELGGKAVFRTLVKDLPTGAGNTYTYSYGQQQNIPFYLHEGLACLWLPDFGRSEELRFTVTSSGGTSTEYTAGNITTVTQRTEAISANPVGVVARVTYGSVNQAYNTLQEAFNEAAKASSTNPSENITVHLLTSVPLSSALTVSGSFALNLDGKNLTASSGGQLKVTADASLVISDGTTGTKGYINSPVLLAGSGSRLFVSGAIRMEGDVTQTGQTGYLWRTLVNMSYQDVSLTSVGFNGGTYKVINREVCLWLPQNGSDKNNYIFTINGSQQTVTGYIISANHNNDMTVGGTNNVARIGKIEYATLDQAFAVVKSSETIELLKASPLTTAQTLAGKFITLQLGKYGLAANAVTPQGITVGTDATLIINSSTGIGQIDAPLTLNGGGLYIGQNVSGDHIGLVKRQADAKVLYRLLVTNLPEGIPTGDSYPFTFAAPSDDSQTGTFVVREGIACLWLEKATARTLTFRVGGKDFVTENVTVGDDHFNTETYGVNDVAQIRNGKKYRELHTAFNEAAGRTILLLKNAALTQNVTISTNVSLETGDYGMTAQDLSGSEKAAITVGPTGSLQISGNGNISSGFSINTASNSGNANLIVEKDVNLMGNSLVRMNGTTVYRVSLDGLPTTVQEVKYTYKNQSGDVNSSAKGTLCLWMTSESSPASFTVDVAADNNSYQETSVVITGTHANAVSVSRVSAVAEIGSDTYDTLEEALGIAASGNTVKLRKNVAGLSGIHALSDDLTAENRVILDFDNKELKAGGLTFDAKKAQFVLQNGTLTGTLSLIGNVYVAPDATMTGAYVSMGGKTVWRTFLTLPDGTTTFSYRMGSDAATLLTTSTNIYTVDGHPMACLWLPSSNMAQPLTVKAGNQEYILNNIIIASTHGNELNVLTNNKPVAETGGMQYASLASALAAATEGGIVTLKDNLSLASVQEVTKSLTLGLANFSFTSSGSGFDVATGKMLTLKQGMLMGSVRLKGEGMVKTGIDVTIAGLVLDKVNMEVCRTLIKLGPAAMTTECRWIKPVTMEYDLTLTQDADTYEATVPVTLSGHNTTLTAYKHQDLAGDAATWQADYANTNLVLAKDAVLDISGAAGATIHRLTLCDGARVKGSGQVTASEGIRYIRTFEQAGTWESIALPFSTTRVMAEKIPGTVSLLTPASGTGTAGDFWLYTMQVNGQQIPVNGEQMEANEAYIMAVPTELARKEITFVSAPRQVLRRNPVQAVVPVSGFASYANGTLDEITVKDRCYVLNTLGTLFKRQEVNYTLPPFRGYLLADMATTNNTPELRMGIATDVPEIEAVDGSLVVRSLPGRLLVDSPRKTWLSVYTFTGYRIYQLRIPEGHTEIPMERGAYIVNGQKLLIR